MARGIRSRDLLSPETRAAARQVYVWVISWELPDKSWEAVCSSEEIASAEFRTRKEDSLVSSWGSVQRHSPVTLEAWYDGHTEHNAFDASMYATAVQTLLSPDAGGTSVVVRTW